MHDFGYDVSDYKGVDPVFGSLADFDGSGGRRRASAGLACCSTSCPATPRSSTRGSASTPTGTSGPTRRTTGRRPSVARPGASSTAATTCTPSIPSRPDLDWRNPELIAAMQDVAALLDRARRRRLPGRCDRPAAEGRAAAGRPARERAVRAAAARRRGQARADQLAQRARHRRGARQDPRGGGRRAARGRGLPAERQVAAVPGSPRRGLRVRAAARALGRRAPAMPRSRPRTARPGAAWVLSNHDFGRLATRFGPENARAAALLLLTLPGPAFLYQGDEIGLGDGPGGEQVYDRAGRDRFRHPMQWDASPGGGFTTGEAWLPPVDPERTNVEAQREDPRSTLSPRARSAALRRVLGEGLRACRRRSGSARLPPRRPPDRHQHHIGEDAAFPCSATSAARDHAGRVARRHARGALRRDYAV